MSQKKTVDAGDIAALLDIMARLRNPEGGCPWDLEQDFSSIAPYTLEEAYEVADAIERNVPGDIRDELGDLLFQVVFHAQMAKEKGWFEFADVVEAINDKMLRRHPHVFGDEQVADARAQTEAWEQHKAKERGSAGEDGSALANVTVALPALVRAQKIQRRAARTGFDWDEIDDVLAKLEEEVAELRAAIGGQESLRRQHEELGDILFSCVNLARFLDADAEQVLRHANNKFAQRFREVEALAATAGRQLSDCTLDELEDFWQQAKHILGKSGRTGS
ncbi:ATP diphosphatase [Thiogranum longum]|uniref:Nucleoside triphosphate pyrophosphohydrolase n=1 Tax=Thiogranum longum TaxID=1537524 RepID=A0A4R1HFZ1_9GAMM|nr:nucleoside triphosphate pyrophosphohydrolase [Thiogranum longum]TCK19170.1 ATP diphosphatase [Thiogranum longum]